MHAFIADLIKDGPVLTDGSWGTQIIRRGLQPRECPDSWNLSHPELVEEVAREYVDAGSRVILTNTFGANRFVLGKFGLAEKVAEINVRGVEISRRAALTRACVFASMGPSGKLLAARDVTKDELEEAFDEQARAIAQAGPDAIVVETMMDLAEAAVAAEAAKRTGLPVVACLVFDAGRAKDRTMMGNTPEQAVEVLGRIGVDVVGANCGQGIEGFIPICSRMRAATDLPIWMKPNAGLPERVDGQTVYRTTPEEFSGFIPDLVRAGASFIGGCCGTEQAFIREIGNALNSMK
ncbi:MAG TPA: homocysteine S-methyltransferase family protein [Deltaproteobacteria bacterium]|nr:homocysteine S-methyltransferase family protein [Deltaproteobacteria bacterium]HPR55070.1 homocysteine S-methyltransferase family protein [Deltaproteobacteria bacterium]HXK47907.1 homocysteine S-methyltransferase family protein [Deltaproteobacteria bacterium]